MIGTGPIPESQDLREYLEATEIIDWPSSDIQYLAEILIADTASEEAKARCLYQWVRDEVSHSADAGRQTVTCRATDALRHRTGICYAKAHLLAALLRAVGIPAGMCYQILRYDESSDRLVLHGLNGVYLASLGRWFRVDARGNKDGVNAQFSVDREQLAFPVDPGLGEFTCETVFTRPLPSVVDCLTSNATVTELMANLPQSIDNTK